ncbi:LysR family transcriptional regulator [Flavobacterium sp. '19STA2R22 D10 B1']|uniref:LysR family transcriptional regulator n=1 Tax=Flavobacterium aerium TaxID=3037261 RepID=UPI00278C1FF8|nr:LysR family transcriptional regulator [Flavobacterium sp. '19STA2R22 D10 B1']
MVNLEWYRTFKAIYRKGTLTGAAEELFISQPNVSQHLSALEAHIGQKLFERKPRKMVPTDYGKQFYSEVIEAIEKLEQVETNFRYTMLSRNCPQINLGANLEYFDHYIAPRINESPGNLSVEFGTAEYLTSRLIKGKLDFVIVNQQIDIPTLTYTAICTEEYFLVGNTKFNTEFIDEFIRKKEYKELECWLAQQNWLINNSDMDVMREFWMQNFKKRPCTKPKFDIPFSGSILKAIHQNGGLTIVPAYLLQTYLDNQELKILWKGLKPITNTIYLAYDTTKVTTQQIAIVKKLMRCSVPLR